MRRPTRASLRDALWTAYERSWHHDVTRYSLPGASARRSEIRSLLGALGPITDQERQEEQDEADLAWSMRQDGVCQGCGSVRPQRCTETCEVA